MSLNQHTPKTSLFLGGARSGKSKIAEDFCTSTGFSPVYLATAQAQDSEMVARIEIHKNRRAPNWRLLETPLNLSEALSRVKPTEIILIDCLTLWLSNVMFSGRDLLQEQANLCTAIKNCAGKTVCVSNEVGMGIVPESTLGRQFRDAQGSLNQEIAALSELVVFAAAGLPLVLKGSWPNDH